MERINTSGANANRAALLTRGWTAEDWEQWLGFSATLLSFGVGFLACWFFGA